MNAPAPQATDPQRPRQADPHSADLAELLGHVMNCWDDDRRQLARKMHDSLGSTMTALTMHLALLTQHLPQEKVLQDRAAQMKSLLMNIINTNRDLQLGLWNDKLEFLGIKAAISELVAHFNQQHGKKARVSLPDEDPSYSAEQGVALLRCVEEGLSNVVAHSQATDIDVVLDDNEEAIMLSVRDNGVGPGGYDFTRLDCHGLRLVRARARHLGGELTLAPAGQQGTLLRVTLPKTAPV